MSQVSWLGASRSAFPDGLSFRTWAPISVDGKPLHLAAFRGQREAAPGVLHSDQVRLRVLAFSCNYRERGLLAVDGSKERSARPWALGSEFAGEVTEVGSAVECLVLGDRVMGAYLWPQHRADQQDGIPGVPTNGASCDSLVLSEKQCVRIPSSMAIDVAAGFALGGQTAFSMVRRSGVVTGDRVLVTACRSNTSLFVIQALRSRGARIFGLSTSMAGMRLLEELGVEECFTVADSDPFDLPASLYARALDLGGFDAVCDPFANRYLHRCADLLTVGGRYVTCGLTGSSAHEDRGTADLLWRLILRNASLVGNCMGATEDILAALAAHDAGHLRVVIDSVHDVEAFDEFVRRSFASTDRLGKVILRWG